MTPAGQSLIYRTPLRAPYRVILMEASMFGILGGLVASLSACTALPASAPSHSNSPIPETTALASGPIETPLPGLVQIEQNHAIIYVTADGRYEFEGDLIDEQTHRNLTEDARRAVRQRAVASLDAITFGATTSAGVEHVVTVFVDVDCGYCRRLHSQMAEYNARGITVRYLAWPRSGPGTASWKKAESVWCAQDRDDVLTAAMSGQPVKPATCANDVAAEYELGVELGVHGTPTMILPDGSLLAGYLPPSQLTAKLQALGATPD